MDAHALRPKILIIDDTPPNIRVLGQTLQREYDVLVATSGAAGIVLAAAEKPDLILLDIMMPGMDGYEVCQRLKANPALAAIPVIFITAMAQEEDEARGFAVGAVDYIRKPFSLPVAQARIQLHLALKNAHKALELANQKKDEELEHLAALQQRLLPNESLRVPGLEIHSLYRPSGKACGDYFDYFKISNDIVRVVVADVSGHGARAAFVMGIVRSLFRQSRIEGRGLSTTVDLINKHLVETIGEETDFVTLFAADLHLGLGEFEYVNSGHCPALLLANGELKTLKPNSRILGFFDEDYLSLTILNPSPFKLLLYTDGFYEWKKSSGELFAYERFVELAGNALSQDGFSLERLEELLAVEDPKPIAFRDDCTALYVTWTAPPKPRVDVQLQHRPKLLIVDDEPATVRILSQAFRQDYEMFIARTGEDGLAIGRRERPDLILLDVVMPGMDGYMVCKQLKDDPRTRDIPVVFMSARDEEEDELRGLELGAVDYIAKPFSLPIVRTRLRNHLDLKEKTDRLHDLAAQDGLTGIPNLRAFEDRLQREWRAAIRAGASLGLVLVDIDGFKRYNNMYGPVAGDDCLRLIAKTIQDAIRRPKDIACRYGGEEFAVLLPDTDLRGARKVGEIIMSRIAALKLPHEGSRIADMVTVSLGVAAIPPPRDGECAQLVETAKRNLSRAQTSGGAALDDGREE
jgi:sigma-B regulation protein RsbU (phosphoserine phosphatase)